VKVRRYESAKNWTGGTGLISAKIDYNTFFWYNGDNTPARIVIRCV
jgi:hypothetical protein